MILSILAAAHSLGGYPVTLAKMRHDFEVMVAADDLDHDRRISRAEWQRLFEVEFSANRLSMTPENRSVLKRDNIREFDREDLDHDGFLTVDEMVQSRVADFRCVDANHDGVVTRSEAKGTMGRCAN